MERITDVGRFLFGISMVGFGIQEFIYTGFLVGLELVPEWIPGHSFWAFFTGAIFIGSGVCITVNQKGRLAASLLGVLFFLCVVLLHGPRSNAVVRDIVERTRAFETLALGGGALIVAAALPAEDSRLIAWNDTVRKAVVPARFFVAVSMAVFGLGHLQAARFVAGLVPSWIPWHLFWVYLTAAGFFAAAVSTATMKFMILVENLLGLMFLLWVVFLHAPRVAAHLHNGDEWNSLLVALALSGAAFVTANGLQTQEQTRAKFRPPKSRSIDA